ncbi:Glycosyltransferase involved in cell wall bisynthesis [Dyadobacter soli]|uniref:Glycosyltransferase involved in cell wall bisynthesis n=1 Tax=Dyadobacter soli TaxID=659014 RepID=A0A1G6XF43_9BACT|nr:glycosyltransferase [Dyadobacter soli]SDD76819.1 Glycosyltransferase involved in cell wall bisynthesis [Dyadobacter soli]
MMRVLIVHNQLWAHYKSKLFSEIDRAIKRSDSSDELLVAQIALYEESRKVMQSDDTVVYDYPYKVLFERSLDQVSFRERREALFKVFNAYRPDVLNITGYFDWAQVLLMFHARRKGVKVVLSSESSSADHNRSSWKERVKKVIVNRANAFFCFGKTSAEYLESLGVAKSAITVRNAAVIDEQMIRQRYDAAKKELAANVVSRKFVYVGRLAPEKNLTTLILAFAQAVKTTGSDWQLLFVGGGPEKERLEKLVSDSGIADKVIFAGGFPWYQVPDWLAKSDVLVLPSQSEPWGLVVNEAMVCGMPVIVSETCGCVGDLVQNGVNGFTFKHTQQADLEKHLTWFIQNPDRIAGMGQESLKLIAPFAAGPVAAQMAATYRELAGKAR